MGSQEFILGFFYVFIYKDFFFRELFFAFHHHKEEVSLVLDEAYSSFFERHMVFWVYTMQSQFHSNNLFKSYSEIVEPTIPDVIKMKIKERLYKSLWACWSYQQIFRKSLAFLFEVVP